jgi:predicted nucleotidyltransferase component of viral defense system
VKTSVKLIARIRDLSKRTGVEAEILLRSFMLERLLERISVSKYKQNFLLKGGMLVAAMVGINSRSTMDMDATITGQTLTASELTAIFAEILNVPMDDGVRLSFLGIEEIREEADYPGYRVSIGAVLDKTRQILKVDITTGDSVTPKGIEYKFKLMLENRAINIMAYNVETVLAEKFQTMISRGVTNTRMRDFCDVYILTANKQFDPDIFRAALDKTAEKRGTVEQLKDTNEIITNIKKDPILKNLWQRYSKNYRFAANLTWAMVIGAVKTLKALVEGNKK